MESLQRIFFEEPTAVYVVLALGALVPLGLWWMRRQRKILLWLLLPAGLAIAVFSVERLVVTDREQIRLNTEDIARKIESGDVRGAAIYLDDQCGGRWLTRELAIRAGEEFLRSNPVRKISLTRLDINAPNRNANMEASTVIDFSSGGSNVKIPLVWKVHWIKKDGRWLINEVDFRQGLQL